MTARERAALALRGRGSMAEQVQERAVYKTIAEAAVAAREKRERSDQLKTASGEVVMAATALNLTLQAR